jgi:non-homologous end joining protein Ku
MVLAGIKLARTLVEASTAESFDLRKCKDEYMSQVSKLIETKASGKKVTAARAYKEPAVINLMDALRQSLHKVASNAASGHGN